VTETPTTKVATPKASDTSDGYLAACRDFEDLLTDVLPASTETAPVLPYYEVAAVLHGSDERVLYTSLSDAYSTAHALTRHYETVHVWNGKTLHCLYDRADGQWKALTPEAKELETEWEARVAEAQANPDRPRKPLPLWFLHR